MTRAAVDVTAEVSALEFREAFSNVTTAVSVITTSGLAGVAGLTCSAVCAVSDAPPTLAACVSRRSAANHVIRANGVFCVNCLRSGQEELSQLFAGIGSVPMPERFSGDGWLTMTTGAPCHRDALVTLECTITDVHDIGTHSLFIATVVATSRPELAEPLIYHRRAYATTRHV